MHRRELKEYLQIGATVSISRDIERICHAAKIGFCPTMALLYKNTEAIIVQNESAYLVLNDGEFSYGHVTILADGNRWVIPVNAIVTINSLPFFPEKLLQKHVTRRWR